MTDKLMGLAASAFGLGLYILDEDDNPVKMGDSKDELIRWAVWFETHKEKRVVARTEIEGHDVSTVFIGTGDTLWETMEFTEDGVGHMRTYDTKEKAEKGHWEVVELVINKLVEEEE
jgi:hypothetical protein